MDRDMVSGIPVRETRRARLLRGSLRLSSGTVIPILVRNLSERGLGMSSKSTPPKRGEMVIVTLPGSPELNGVVRWVRDKDFGVELTGSVDSEQLATAIRQEISRSKETADWQVSSLHRVSNTPQSTRPRRPI
jgi:hypothetical protein